MRKILFIFLTLLFVSSFQNAAQATVITFDDLPETTYPIYWGSIHDGYKSLNWYNFGYLDVNQQNLGITGYQNGVVSNPMVAFNQYGNPGAIYSDTAFTFNNAFLTAAWEEELNVSVRGYLNGAEKYFKNVVLSTSAPTNVLFDFQNVDYLSFYSYGGITLTETDQNHFVMDNIVINEPLSPLSVPEPSLVILGTLGFLGSFSLRKRNSTHSEK